MTGGGRASARSRTKSSSDADDRNEPPSSSRKPKTHFKPRRDRGRTHDSIRIFKVDLKLMLGIGVISFFVIFLLIHHLINPAEQSPRPRVITPFPAPKLMDLPQFQGDHKESLYWGTYRPHVYFGIRARTPRSLIAGLMWIGIKDGRYFMRHVCQDSDELSKYGWTQHNGRDFGHQVIVDEEMTLATSFLKSKQEGSGYGGDWAVRIDVQSESAMQNEEPWRNTGHLFFYVADEEGSVLSLNGDTLDIHGNSLVASGSQEDFGSWQLHMKSQELSIGAVGPLVYPLAVRYTNDKFNSFSNLLTKYMALTSHWSLQDDLEVHYSGFRTPHIHNLSDLVQHSIATQVHGNETARKFGLLELSDISEVSPNIAVFQISSRIPFMIDIAYLSGAGSESPRIEERFNSLTGTSLTSQLKEKQREFEAKFEKNFNRANKLDLESIVVGKAAIANMLGGIGYFYGQSKISLPKGSNVETHNDFIAYWPAELYTAVPSRPFFPRGFLWDEGFHQLLIWRWDIHISLDIIGHWLDLMNVDGWIPREQILGTEALSKVPEEFVAQHPTNGNPPTLFLVLHDLIHGLKKNKFNSTESNEISSFLERAFVRLEAWYQWFNTTQSGKEMSIYYWHGRDNSTTRELNPKTLSSGLDDYPRASHPTENERHLDLRCWMLLAADCLHSIAELLGKKTESGKDYGSTAKLLSDFEILNQMHFEDESGAYFDFGYHAEKVRLIRQYLNVGNNHASRELVREVLENPRLRLVPHIGYVSLFPFMWRLIPPDSWILGKQLDLISNRSILWTDFGIRSLAKTSSLYMKRNTEHDPPYWRGPIWMNMNYMILSALDHYSREDGPFKKRARTIYDDLRGNLIRNVVRNYYQTGFLWEQYDQKNGKGKGARLFTGWTSLVLLMMGEAYAAS